jgi:hypothetical protein
MKLPVAALWMENTHIWENIECNLTADISVSWSKQYAFKFIVVKLKFLSTKIQTPPIKEDFLL